MHLSIALMNWLRRYRNRLFAAHEQCGIFFEMNAKGGSRQSRKNRPMRPLAVGQIG